MKISAICAQLLFASFFGIYLGEKGYGGFWTCIIANLLFAIFIQLSITLSGL